MTMSRAWANGIVLTRRSSVTSGVAAATGEVVGEEQVGCFVHDALRGGGGGQRGEATGTHAGFFGELALGGRFDRLTVVDTSGWHLPGGLPGDVAELLDEQHVVGPSAPSSTALVKV